MTVEGFEVLDALEDFGAPNVHFEHGLCTLEKRTPTLDGSVPLRVAQGCLPMLEGNAFGFQVVMRHAMTVQRSLGRWKFGFDDALRRRVDGALPRLVAQGFLAPRWRPVLRRLVWVERSVIHLWTGLLVRPLHGLGLRLAAAANRRNRALDVRTAWLDEDALVPLVVSFSVVGDSARLEGEIACLSLHPRVTPVRIEALSDGPEIGRRHAEFFDEAYFAAKREKITGKYRSVAGRLRASRHVGEGGVRVIAAGPVRVRVESGPNRVVFANTVAFSAIFDGHTLTVRPDRDALLSAAAAVEDGWRSVYGEGAVERDRRALWYLTKYFTPHTPGEPNFFVKPPAFTVTPPGWSTVIEGIGGAGYDILRGVVATDVFHATPAVFAMHGSGVEIRVPAGTDLIALHPVPRWTLSATWRPLQFADV